ncbi:MAG: hypothetical protein II826_05535 [Prevotella sp.]|nr:hypothetical protein [Prevotella sp.]
MSDCTRWTIGIATVLHLLVDGLCVCALYLMVGNADGARLLALFLAYNVLAFMTQPLTGWWADRSRSRHGPLLVAIVLLSAAVALQMVAVLRGAGLLPLCAVLLGMGNSFFHVWGGKQTAVLSGNDMRSLGIFVSSGVLGLTVGVLYASWWLLAAMLLLVSVLGAVASRIEPSAGPLPPSARRETAGLPSMAKTPAFIAFWLLAILIFVLLRSFVGEVVSVGLEKSSAVLLLLAVTAMAGKACGGWLARWLGISRAIVACLGIVAACMMFRSADSVPLLPVVAGVLAINFTMPMTLHLANRLLPRREGLAFGLLAAVLIPGYMLAHSLPLSPDYYFMLSALLLTIAVEVGLLMLMGETRADVLVGAVAVNILTNVPLNYLLLTFGNSVGRLMVGEVLVLVVETLWYFCFVRRWQRAVVYSLLCNATSFLVGILIQYIIKYSL